MKPTLLAPIIAAVGVSASPAEIAERQSCPGVYIFGARETTAPPGYGTAGGLVNQVLAAYSGSQASAITYPACGGQASCGGASYDSSAQQGTTAVVSAVNSLNSRCPSTQIVLIGYSQVYICSRDPSCSRDRSTPHHANRCRGINRVVRSWTTPCAAAPAPL